MKFIIKHQIKGRIRIHLVQNTMSLKQADTLQYYLDSLNFVKKAKVYEQTADAAIEFTGDSVDIINALKKFSYEKVDVPSAVISSSGRELNSEYKEKLVKKISWRLLGKYILPAPISTGILIIKAIRYIKKGDRLFA